MIRTNIRLWERMLNMFSLRGQTVTGALKDLMKDFNERFWGIRKKFMGRIKYVGKMTACE